MQIDEKNTLVFIFIFSIICPFFLIETRKKNLKYIENWGHRTKTTRKYRRILVFILCNNNNTVFKIYKIS